MSSEIFILSSHACNDSLKENEGIEYAVVQIIHRLDQEGFDLRHSEKLQKLWAVWWNKEDTNHSLKENEGTVN
jgi:hypothetical protein